MGPFRLLYEQTTFSLEKFNKTGPYLEGWQHLWLFLQLIVEGRQLLETVRLTLYNCFVFGFKDLVCP